MYAFSIDEKQWRNKTNEKLCGINQVFKWKLMKKRPEKKVFNTDIAKGSESEPVGYKNTWTLNHGVETNPTHSHTHTLMEANREVGCIISEFKKTMPQIFPFRKKNLTKSQLIFTSFQQMAD